MSPFDDLLDANAAYAKTFAEAGLAPVAARGVAILTCFDSRIEPLRMLGLAKGDAKILRNAGARVTDDVLRTLVLATHLLGVDRVFVVPHTRCRMAENTEEDIHRVILDRAGVDTRSLEFRTEPDQVGALRGDLVRIRAYPLLPGDLAVGGAIYDVDTGLLDPIDLGVER
ncbi:MAG: beta-class carbonic anhydrase [Actinomycetes bacterium]